MAITVDANSGTTLNIGAGYQNWSATDSPAGAIKGAILVVNVGWQAGYGPIDTPTYGNVDAPLVHWMGASGTGLGESALYVYFAPDVTGRDDDVWRHESTGLQREAVPIYLNSDGQLTKIDDGEVAGGSGDVGPSLTGTGMAIGFANKVKSGGAGVGEIGPISGWSTIYERDAGSPVHGAYYDASFTGTGTVGANYGAAHRHATIGMIVNEGDVVFNPDQMESLTEYVAGLVFSVGADVTILPTQPLRSQTRYVDGLRFIADGPREVALVGEDLETPEMTTPPAGDGPWVLGRESTSVKPDWKAEADIAGASSAIVYSDGILDPPEPAWHNDGSAYVTEADLDQNQ